MSGNSVNEAQDAPMNVSFTHSLNEMYELQAMVYSRREIHYDESYKYLRNHR